MSARADVYGFDQRQVAHLTHEQRILRVLEEIRDELRLARGVPDAARTLVYNGPEATVVAEIVETAQHSRSKLRAKK